MKTIWKFQLEDKRIQGIKMPTGARVLITQAQHGVLCVWAEVDDEAPQVERWFEVFATGEAIPEQMGVARVYVGTAQLHGGDYILHIYERTD